MTPREFLEALFVDLEGEEVCVTTPTQGGAWLNYNLEAGLKKLKDKPGAWYYCVSTTDGIRRTKAGEPSDSPRAMVRRRHATLMRAHVLVCDDIGEKANAPCVDGSYVLESSEGSFHHGFRIEPVDVSGTGALYYEACVRALATAGLSDAGAGGSYRVMRLPGSINSKPGREGFVSRVVSWHPERIWTLEELMEQLGLSPEYQEQKHALKRDGTIEPDDLGMLLDADYVDPVLDWLVTQGHTQGPVTGEWVEITCPWLSETGCHTTGDTAGYKPLGRGSLTHMRGFNCFHSHQDKRTTYKFLQWVVEEGGPHAYVNGSVELLLARYCLEISGNIVRDMHAQAGALITSFKLPHFKNGHRTIAGMRDNRAPLYLCDMWLESPDLKKVDGQCYLPGEGRLVAHKGLQLYNNWVKPGHDPQALPKPGEFLLHLTHVVPDPGDRELFLDWLAYKLQHPAERSYAIIMVADRPWGGNVYGVGRSLLADAIQSFFGQGVPSLELHELLGAGSQSQFNEWMAEAQVVVIEETKEEVGDWRSHTDHFEKLKKMVDIKVAHNVRIKKKYGEIWQANIYCNFLFLTNHYDALRIPKGDRRFLVLDNAVDLRTPEEYTRMAAYTEDEGALAGTYRWLMARDVTGFDKARPPMTDAKDRMQHLAVTEPEALVAMVMDSFAGDLVTKKLMLGRVLKIAEEECEDARTAQVAQMMVRKQWRRLPCLKPSEKKNGGKIAGEAVRVLRDPEKWVLNDGQSPSIEHKKSLKLNQDGIRPRSGPLTGV